MVTVTTESRATLRTSLGNLVLEFISDKAPRTCENFATLAKKGFYDGTTFHRIIKDFIVQGGCPQGTGKGGPGYTIRPEFNDTPHETGVVSMARDNDPHSAGSQFFIVAGEARYLDSRYTAFARVVDGMEVLEKMAAVSTDIQPKYKEKSVPLEPLYLNGVDLEGVEFPVEEPSQPSAPTPAAEQGGESDEGGGESAKQGDGESSSSSGRRSRRGRGRRGKGSGDRSGGDRSASSSDRNDSSGDSSSTENRSAAPEAKNDSAPAAEAPAKKAEAQPAEPKASSDAPAPQAEEKPAAKKATRKKATRKKAVAKDKTADSDDGDKPAAPAKKKATRKKAVRKKPASDAGNDEG